MGNKHTKLTNGKAEPAASHQGLSYAETDKLYYSPAALSGAAVFITAFIGGIDMPCETIDVIAKTSVTGTALRELNVLETVPFVVLADGVVLSEQQVILDYLLERAPKQLRFDGQKSQYFYMKQVMAYINTNLIPSLELLSRPGLQETNIQFFQSIIERALTVIEEYFLERKQYIIANSLSAGDIVLYTALNAAKTIGTDLDRWPRLKAYFDRLDADEHIVAAQTRMLGNPRSILPSQPSNGVF